ncbi:hypothetical protein ACLOJK_011656 [Asimina triloba]
MAHSTNFLLALLFLFLLRSANGAYNILDFGARPDGETAATQSLLKAWAAACASPSPATILVPNGSFLLGPTVLRGPCKSKISIQIYATFLAPSDYAALATSGRWLHFDSVQGLSIYGGTFDGRGAGLWACKAARRQCPAGATSLSINNGKDILISGVTSINSQLFHIAINTCKGVTIQKVKIIAPGNSPNTDGIHVQQSTGVTILGTNIKTGDDCISVGPGTTNLWAEHITCGPGHGISIGSLGRDLNEAGVQNVTVKTVVFQGADNGLRIKSWGRPSSGFVRGVVFQDAIMNNVQNPIIIDQNYCPDNKGCPGQNSGVGISQVSYSNIRGTSATQVAVKFDCSAINPCKGIGLRNVKLIYQQRPAESSCKNAGGTTSGVVVPPSCL